MNPKFIYLGLSVLSLILIFRITAFYHGIEKYSQGQIITWQTRLLDQPKLIYSSQQVWVNMPNSERVLVRFSLTPVLSYGDVIKIKGELDYFEAEDGSLIPSMDQPRFEIVQKGSEANVIIKVRENIIDFFNSSLPLNYASLMLGVVFGIKEEMSSDFYDQLQNTGLMHVIAASGMNITMLGGFLSLFFALFLRRQLALVLTILGIILYALMAGLEPSIVRAALMGILVFLAQLTGRQNSAFLALFAAAFVMLMRSPSLIFDIGFQLSFLATFGLVFLRPIFGFIRVTKKFTEKTVVGEDLATTLTAQIMTLPILLVNFGSYSLLSVPVNAIVLWTVPVLMIIGGLSALVSFVFEPVGRLILYFSVPFLLYFTKIVEVFGSFQGEIEINSLPILVICGYYLIIISIVMYLRGKE